MTRDEIDRALTASEAALEHGGTVALGATGLWKAVGALKRQPDHVDA